MGIGYCRPRVEDFAYNTDLIGDIAGGRYFIIHDDLCYEEHSDDEVNFRWADPISKALCSLFKCQDDKLPIKGPVFRKHDKYYAEVTCCLLLDKPMAALIRIQEDVIFFILLYGDKATPEEADAALKAIFDSCQATHDHKPMACTSAWTATAITSPEEAGHLL